VNLLASATTNSKGQWPVTINGYDMVWVRDPAGNIWTVPSDTVAGDHAARLATLESGPALTTSALDSNTSSLLSTPGSLARTTGDARYYVRGDLVYRVADYATPQACIDAAPSGAVVLFPPGGTTVTTPLSVSKPLTLRGQGMLNSTVTANGCDGIHISAGMTQVNIEALTVAAQTPYTTTTNTSIGILVDGSDAASPGYDVFDKVRVTGFQTAIQTRSLQSSRFEQVYTSLCLYGFDVYGVSMNNAVHGGQLIVGTGATTQLAGSAVVRLNGQKSPTDATADPSEGWIISDSLLYGGDYGVYVAGYNSWQVANNIIDFNYVCGVYITNDGTAPGGAGTIQGNYIAMATGATDAAIHINSSSAPARGSRIFGNEILAYGAGSPYGVWCHNHADKTVVVGNTFAGFGTNDVRLSTSDCVVTGNLCQSAVTNNISTDAGNWNMTAGNIGTGGTGATVRIDNSAGFPNNYEMDGGGKRLMRATAVPTGGVVFNIGDRIVNSSPAVGSPKAWVCTVAGNPGTWVSEGNL
jgi:hypothetical protein